jgi:hypothetical protein
LAGDKRKLFTINVFLLREFLITGVYCIVTYHPGFVQKVVGRNKGVNGGNAAILEAQNEVAPVLVCVSDVLANQQEIRSE